MLSKETTADSYLEAYRSMEANGVPLDQLAFMVEGYLEALDQLPDGTPNKGAHLLGATQYLNELQRRLHQNDYVHHFRHLERSNVPLPIILKQVEDKLSGLRRLPADTEDREEAIRQTQIYLEDLRRRQYQNVAIEPIFPVKPGGFFDPPELETLYVLTHLDGKRRCDALGIAERHYSCLEEANGWLSAIISKLHVCYTSGHPAFDRFGQQAYDKLFEIWSIMTGEGIERYPYPATVSWYNEPVTTPTDEGQLWRRLDDLSHGLEMGSIDVKQAWENLWTLYRQQRGQSPNNNYITNFVLENRGVEDCRFINVVAEDREVGAHFIRDMILETSMSQPCITGGGIDIIIPHPTPTQQTLTPSLLGNIMAERDKWPELLWSDISKQFDEVVKDKTLDPADVTFLADISLLPRWIERRHLALRRIAVVDLFDHDFPINAATFLTNYVVNSPLNGLTVILTNEALSIDGPVLVV